MRLKKVFCTTECRTSHILDAVVQGLDPESTIADFGTKLRAAHQEVFEEAIPCNGNVFHLQHQCHISASSSNRNFKGCQGSVLIQDGHYFRLWQW